MIRQRLGIGTQLTIMTTLVVLVVSGTIGSIFYWGASNSLASLRWNQIRLEVQREGELLNATIEDLRRDALLLADLPMVGQIGLLTGGNSPSSQNLRALQDRKHRLTPIFMSLMHANPHYYQIRLIGVQNNGRELIRVESQAGVPVINTTLHTKAHRAYFQDAIQLKKGEVYLSRIDLQKDNGRVVLPAIPTLRAATPIYDANHKVFGLIVINVDIAHALANINRLKSSERSIYVTNQQGEYLLHPDPALTFSFDKGFVQTIQQDHPELVDFFQNPSAETEYYPDFLPRGDDIKLNPHLVYMKRFFYDPQQPQRNLAIAVEIDYQAFIKDIAVLKSWGLGLTIILILTGMIVAVLFSRLLSQPLHQLTFAVHNVAKGVGHAPLPTRMPGEVGILAQAFNQMVETVQERELSLKISESKLRAIVNSTTAGIITINAQGIIEFCNNAAGIIFCYEQGALQGMDIYALIPELDTNSYFINSHHYLSSDETTVFGAGQKISGLRSDGAVFPLHVSVSEVNLDSDPLIVIVLQDLSYQEALHEQLRETDQQMGQMIENMSDAFYSVDNHFQINYVNRKGRELFGQPRQNFLGENIWAVFPELARTSQPAITESLKSGQEKNLEVYCETLQRWFQVRVHPTENGLIIYLMDETARHQADRELRLAAAVYENTSEAISITDADARFIAVNKAFEAMSGYSQEELIGQKPSLLQSGLHDASFYQKMWQSLESSGVWWSEIKNRRKNGELFTGLLNISTVRDKNNKTINYIGTLADISVLKETEEKLNYLAHHDLLTGLPNRTLLNDRLEQIRVRSMRKDLTFAVIFLDVDHFKHINDSLGYQAGDALLREISARLKKHLPRVDTIARLAGDEFVIIAEDANATHNLKRLTARILEFIKQPISLEQRELNLTVSIGVCRYPKDGRDAQTLLRNAEASMYRAKELGRNEVYLYTEDVTQAAIRRLDLQDKLKQALASEQFILNYQPQIDSRDGHIISAEALIRWNHPEHGLISPLEFLPLAEETGLIIPMGEWVINTTCKLLSELTNPKTASLRMSINVSAKQFDSPNFLKTTIRILKKHAISPHQIELELTESLVMRNPERAIEVMYHLKNLGFSLAMDDFGTGYSSLSLLKHLPLDTLKIDRAFVKDVPDDRDNSAIVRATIHMAHQLGLSVVAEGVETKKQVDFLQQEGCDSLQGYYFSPPISDSSFNIWLAQHEAKQLPINSDT